MPAALEYQPALPPSRASFIPWLLAAWMVAGCATVRPVPAGNEPVVQADVAGVVVTAWSRADAIRLALPAGKLPPGGRTGGFLYFPRMEHAKGMPLVLQWPIREAAGQQVIGTLNLPLEMRAD